MEEAREARGGPIRGQYPGHVITLDQSEREARGGDNKTTFREARTHAVCGGPEDTGARQALILYRIGT